MKGREPKARHIHRVHSSMPEIKQVFNTSKFRIRSELERPFNQDTGKKLGLETAVKYGRMGKSVMPGYHLLC